MSEGTNILLVVRICNEFNYVLANIIYAYQKEQIFY